MFQKIDRFVSVLVVVLVKKKVLISLSIFQHLDFFTLHRKNHHVKHYKNKKKKERKKERKKTL